MTMPFQHNDGGRAISRRPRQRNDCVVRALSVTLDREYDYVYEVLASFGRKCSAGFAFKQYAPAIFDLLDATGSWRSFPGLKGQRRMTLPAFCEQHPHGRYIASMAKHITAIVDGVVNDDFVPGEHRCVYGAWEVFPLSLPTKGT